MHSTLAGRALVSLKLRLADAADVALHRQDKFTPPRRLRSLTGDSDFHATGKEIVRLLGTLAGLQPTDRVLDVGCGAGRVARVLAGELLAPGSYDGFDVVPESIAWCRAHYRTTSVPFRFAHANLYNAMYNPGGVDTASDYRFPYADGSFDLVLATSVFTHLRTDAAERYLSEAARVLAPKGRLFATWFLIRDEPAPNGPALIDFARTTGPEAIADPAIPEAAVAFDTAWVTDRFRAHGLHLREPVHWGNWSGRPGAGYQDIVVADRR